MYNKRNIFVSFRFLLLVSVYVVIYNSIECSFYKLWLEVEVHSAVLTS